VFTGLIEETGIVRRKTASAGGLRFEVQAQKVLDDLKRPSREQIWDL